MCDKCRVERDLPPRGGPSAAGEASDASETGEPEVSAEPVSEQAEPGAAPAETEASVEASEDAPTEPADPEATQEPAGDENSGSNI